MVQAHSSAKGCLCCNDAVCFAAITRAASCASTWACLRLFNPSTQPIERETHEIMNNPNYLADDRQALNAAKHFARQMRHGVTRRDRERTLSQEDLQQLAASGLLAIAVPQAYGGAGVSVTTLIEVIRVLASVDPSVAQTLQSHYSNVDRFARLGPAHLQDFFFSRVLQGERLGNASSERGGANAGVNTTTLTRHCDGGCRLNGSKAYATGALSAEWIAVRALDEQGRMATAFVAREQQGITTFNDWNGMGQRGTASGSVVFAEVTVADAFVHVFPGQSFEAQANRALTFLIHGAIQAGIAVNALQAGADALCRQGVLSRPVDVHAGLDPQLTF